MPTSRQKKLHFSADAHFVARAPRKSNESGRQPDPCPRRNLRARSMDSRPGSMAQIGHFHSLLRDRFLQSKAESFSGSIPSRPESARLGPRRAGAPPRSPMPAGQAPGLARRGTALSPELANQGDPKCSSGASTGRPYTSRPIARCAEAKVVRFDGIRSLHCADGFSICS
jgi:hypothetical protein